MASTTGVIGGVFGAPLPPLLRFENGFKQGARFTKPDIKVETQFIHSFGSYADGGSAAKFLIDQRNADVIFGCAGYTSVGALDVSS